MSWVLIEGEGIWVGVVVSSERLREVVLGEKREDVLCKINMEDRSDSTSLLLTSIKRNLTLYLSGEKVDFFSYPLEMNVSPSARRVLNEVRKIPYGQVRSYKWIAQRLGKRGYRAIGRILSINPLPIVIPCHRVIRADGNLGGFSSGINIKKKLLKLEGVLTDTLVSNIKLDIINYD